MLPPGHIAGGFLAAKAAAQLVPSLNRPEFLALTSFFAFLPDIDFFLVFLKKGKFIADESINHRKFKTHAPLLYLLLFAIYYLLFPEQRLFAWAFIIGTWSHFFIDTFSAEGILWLYPFSNTLYNLPLDRKISLPDLSFFQYWLTFLKEYAKVFSFKLEIILIITALGLLI
ncbi:MAG: metal-dependent hydrolase [Candidatus Doudnabacteria bacterium]|nr:metal-dependent hydrolase [Candidatus Doudnabacteria bacterium]